MSRKIFTNVLSGLFLLSCFASCFQDRWPEYAPRTHLDTWIDSVMHEDYLWYNKLPGNKNLNYFIHPDKFLKSIIYSSKDLNYSHVDTIRVTPEPTYGFDYALYRDASIDTVFNLLVTYVQPESPAAKSGLERGQWIVAVNDSAITRKNENSLLKSTRALSISMGKYTTDTINGIKTDIIVKTDIVKQLSGAMPVEDNPINHYEIIETANGLTGYIVYSHFTPGTRTEPEIYNNRLRSIFQEFASAGVSNMIIDLRYNSGGSLLTAQLLSTLLASPAEMGNIWATLEFNNKKTDKNRTLTLDSHLTEGIQALHIQQGVIISGNSTAGAAATMIHTLAPTGKWALVGSSVKCPGVATEEFIYPKETWSLNPVTCWVKNSLGETAEGQTYQANISCSDTQDLTRFLPFGNRQEALLETAISLIEGTYTPPENTSSLQPVLIKEIKASRNTKTVRNGCYY